MSKNLITARCATLQKLPSRWPLQNFSATQVQHFSTQLLLWFARHGRHNLPWQVQDPYAVWISEIMLQQTQVTTVLGFYQRFMGRFPTLAALAGASQSDVLDLWVGLGYYSRARNLHKTAQLLHTIHQQTGTYPQTLDEWIALPGIGRSTAGAILALGLGHFGVICDGNVKRVLARQFAISDDISKSAGEKQLWYLATQLTPRENSGKFAQAMMDLGAMICSRSRPNCPACPVQSSCQAYAQGMPTAYPIKFSKPVKITHDASALWLQAGGKTLLIKRPDHGIWGGLWCLPMHTPSKPESAAEQALYHLISQNHVLQTTKSLRHSLTHFHWQITLMHAEITCPNAVNELLKQHDTNFIWTKSPTDFSCPTAMQKLLVD